MDQYRDILNRDLVKIAGKLSSTEFIDEFEMSTESDLTKLASHQFAWPEARLYPIDSPQNTVLSGLFLLEKQSQLTPANFARVKGNIVKAASLHGVADVLLKCAKEVIDKEDKEHNPSLEDSDYALVVEHNGKTERLYPIKSDAQVKAAQSHFDKNWMKYPIGWRKHIAKRLCDEACKRDIDITSEKVLEYAGAKDMHVLKAAEAVAERLAYCPREYAPVYAKITRALEKQASFNTDLDKFADVLDRLDQVSGMDRLARQGYFPDARATVFNKEVHKVAAAPIKIDGEEYDTDDLANTPLEVYEAALGKNFVDNVKDGTGKLDLTKLFDIIPTLPKPDQALLAMAISKHWKARQENPGDRVHEAFEPNRHPGGQYGSA